MQFHENYFLVTSKLVIQSNRGRCGIYTGQATLRGLNPLTTPLVVIQDECANIFQDINNLILSRVLEYLYASLYYFENLQISVN